jgi:uncharacterized protein YdeI (BOF family)
MADIGPWDTDENIISNVTALQTDMAAAEADIDDLEAISADRDEPTGFVYADPDTIPVTLSFVNGTRTLTVAPSASTFSFYVEGVKYTKSASETIVIANTEGAHFIYYDENGDLASTTTWSIDIIMKYAYVAAIYWDATNAKQIYLGYECHGVKMDGHTHSYLHESRGSQLESGGGGVGGISSDDAVPDADSTKFSVTQAEFWDEDVHITLNAKGTGDNIALYYKSGADASDIWRVDESAVNVCLATGGVGENRAAYNQNNGGTWQLTECTDNYYVLAHVFAFNDQTRKFGIIIGQNEYSSKLNAREGAITELQTLDLRGVLTQEIKMLATIIVHTKETYSGNAIYSRVVTTDGGEDFIDWRNSPLPQGGTSSTVTDHGALGGLDDTDHPASAIFTDVTNFNGNLSASDTTVQAALDTLDDAIPASIISGSASATITADGLDITDGSTSVHINISSGDLVILNSNDGGDVYIKGEVATDTEKTIFKGAPDGAAELYYSGTKKIETTSGGVKIGDGSSAGYEIEYDTGVMYVTNTQHAGIVYHQVEDTNGDVRNMIGLNPNGADTQVYLYAGTGVWVFKTVDNGTIGGFELGRSSTLAKLNVNSGTGDFKIQNVSDGGDIYITGEVATDTEKTMAKFAPDGAAELYYAGTAILATTAAGISITDGTATAATIGFSEDDLIIDNNDVAGLIILKGEKTGPSEVTLASFNPDGAAELYYAGTKIFETLSNGIKIPFSASTSLEITPSGNGVDFYSEYQGAPIKFRARNGADDADVQLISMDSNDTITMYHQGTAVFQLLSNGLAVNGGGGTATGFNFTVSNPDVTILNKWDGGDVYIKGEVATDTEKTMAKFAPDGAEVLETHKVLIYLLLETM